MNCLALRARFIWVFFFLCFLGLTGCQEQPSQPAPAPAPEASASPEAGSAAAPAPAPTMLPAGGQGAPVPEGQALELLRFGPEGEVTKLNQVAAMFNQPMVALGDYNNVPAGALTLDPPVAGGLVWLNQYTLAFVPKAPLTGSLTVTARLDPAALTALSGAKLEKGGEVRIHLPDLGILHSTQKGRPALDEDQALTPRWLVVFNQEPALDSLTENFHFVYDEDSREVNVPASVKKIEDWRGPAAYEFTAKEKLPPAVKYRLVLEAGVKSLAGPEPSSRLVIDEGATYGPLTVTLGSPEEDGGRMNPGYDLHLSFSNPVKIADLLPYIRLNNGYDLTPLKKEYAPEEKPAEAAAEGEGAAEAAPAQDDDGADEEIVEGVQDYLFLPGGFKAGTEYTLTIDGAAKDIFGQRLGKTYTAKFTTGEYETSLSLSEDYGLMETATEPKLRLTASNIKEARLSGYALTAEEAIRFLAEADFTPNYYGEVEESAAKTLKGLTSVKMTVPVPDGAKNGPTVVPVDLAKLFGDRLKDHFLYVKAAWSARDENDGQMRAHQTFALVQVSDIGLAVKVGPESALIWTTNLAGGTSWSGVDLELRGPDGRMLWSGRSDENGLAVLPGVAELAQKMAGSDLSLFVVARTEGQMSLWNVSWDEGLETWRWNLTTGEPLDRGPEADHWLLSALPLYKPGETAKFKIIARETQGDQVRDVAGEELEVQVRDANYEVVETATLAAGPFGTLTHELKIPPDASLGQWTVHLAKPGVEGSESMAGSFLVMTYRAPAFEIKLEGQPKDATAGEKAELTVQADYHFGSPVAGQPARYSVQVSPTDFRLPGDFGDYSVVNRFSQADEDYDDTGYGYQEPSVTVASDEAALDKAGALKIPLDLAPAPDQKPLPRTYETFVTVTDVDQRQVSTHGSFLVHPAALYAGLGNDNFVAEAGRPYTVKVIAADHQGKLAPGKKISTTLYHRTWQNVRRKSPGAAYEYVSRRVDEKVSEASVTSDKLPVELALNPEKPGYYWVLAEITDDQGRVNQAGLDFYVSGAGPVGWHLGNDDRLTLVPDRQEYQPGQTARIMVQSPFEQGMGLMTVERAGVRQSRVFKIDSQTPILEVPLTEDDTPNVFVSVLLARGRIADKPDETGLDFGKPAIRLGYTELKVPSKKDLLTVSVAPDKKEVGPGGEVEVSLAVTDGQGRPVKEAEVALIAADAAVVQLAGDSGYYPNTQYHRDRPLLIKTADNLVSLIGRQAWGLKGGNAGGGGGEMMAALAKSADDVRRAFSALAWFEPRVALDQDGRAKVKMKMPENLTTFKIYAVATGHGRKTGTGLDSVLVTRDLLARSALPNYAGVGDEFAAAMVVTNRGKKEGQATVKLEGENFTLMDGQAEKTVAVGPGQSQEVSFRVKAGQAAQAKFLFSVSMNGDKDRVEFAVPVSPSNQLSTQASYERLAPGEWRTDLAVTEGLDQTRGGLSLEISPSLVGVLTEPFDWMRLYPHGCVEQNTSKGYASLVWLRLKDRMEPTPEKEAAARKNVTDILSRLTKWEYSGGYNFWPNTYDWPGRSVYLTAYVLDFMLSAQADGFELPDPAIIGRLTSFLKGALSGENKSWPAWYSETAVRQSKSYALAMLSRAGDNAAAYIEVMYSDRHNLGLFELINLARAVKFQPPHQGQAGQLGELLALIAKHLNVTAGEIQLAEAPEGAPEIWSSSVRTTAMTLTALTEIAPDSALMPSIVRWLVSASRAGHFGTTQNNAAVLSALSAYVKVMEPESPDLTVTARLGETELAQAVFKSFTDPAVTGTAPLTAIPHEAPSVVYTVEGHGQAWASLTMKTAPTEPDLSAATSGGFMLSRSFTVVTPEKGQPGVNTFQRGQVVRVSVTMMVPAPRHEVVLEDRVPAGFEPINFNLADADLTLLNLAQNEDEGENRGIRTGYWYNHQEIWPDRVAVYATRLDAGVYTFSYLARAVTPGTYVTPGPRAEEMYAPETSGRGEGKVLKVE